MNMVDNDSVSVKASACAMGIPARSGTIYTGDSIQDTPVISQLNVHDLELGKKHRFFFQGAQMGTGQHWYVPVVVAKGLKTGSASY